MRFNARKTRSHLDTCFVYLCIIVHKSLCAIIIIVCLCRSPETLLANKCLRSTVSKTLEELFCPAVLAIFKHRCQLFWKLFLQQCHRREIKPRWLLVGLIERVAVQISEKVKMCRFDELKGELIKRFLHHTPHQSSDYPRSSLPPLLPKRVSHLALALYNNNNV